MEPQHDNSGILFVNDRKTQDNHPDRKGYATVAGVKYYVSGWVKEGAKGRFMTMAFTPQDEKPAAEPTTPPDDSIPF